MQLELHDLLKLRKSELLHAPEERKAEIQADIIRIRTAIATEKEMRKSVVPTKNCGAAAAAERRDAIVTVDEEQWRFESERRLASTEEKKPELTEPEKELIRQAFKDGKCRINGNVVEIDE
jgi:hypothetical protein